MQSYRPTPTQLILVEEKNTYECAVAPGPISVTSSNPDSCRVTTRYILLTGLWTIKGKADLEFVDNTGKSIFEWHPRRTVRPRSVARTLVRSFPTAAFPFRIPPPTVSLSHSAKYSPSSSSSSQVQNLQESKAARKYRKPEEDDAAPSSMLATVSDKRVGELWPVFGGGEPNNHARSEPNVAHEAKDGTALPACICKKPKADTESRANDGSRVKEAQGLNIKSEYLSSDSGVNIERIEQTTAELSESLAEQDVKLETGTSTNDQQSAGIKRQRDFEEEKHDAKRQRNQFGCEKVQVSSKADETVIKTDTQHPVPKRQRDSHIQEDEHVSRRQRRPIEYSHVQTPHEDDETVGSIKKDAEYPVLKRERSAENEEEHSLKRPHLEPK